LDHGVLGRTHTIQRLGLALVVVRSKSGTPGAMTLTTSSDGLTSAASALTSR
jgi:hypothetical protein